MDRPWPERPCRTLFVVFLCVACVAPLVVHVCQTVFDC